MTLNEVWGAIDLGKTIYWGNKSYKITVEDSNLDWRKENNLNVPFSNRDGKCLKITCISNYFGSLLNESELSSLFLDIEEELA